MRFVSFDSVVAAGIPFEPRGEGRERSPHEIDECRESAEAVRSWVNSLPSRERDVIISHFGLGCTPSTLNP